MSKVLWSESRIEASDSGLGTPFVPLGSVASIAAKGSAVIEIVTMRLMKSAVITRSRKRGIIAQMAHGGRTREDAHGRL